MTCFLRTNPCKRRLLGNKDFLIEGHLGLELLLHHPGSCVECSRSGWLNKTGAPGRRRLEVVLGGVEIKLFACASKGIPWRAVAFAGVRRENCIGINKGAARQITINVCKEKSGQGTCEIKTKVCVDANNFWRQNNVN